MHSIVQWINICVMNGEKSENGTIENYSISTISHIVLLLQISRTILPFSSLESLNQKQWTLKNYKLWNP
jgi:hypothetical protein